MQKKPLAQGGAKELNETVRKLSHKKDAPKAVFAALLVLFILASVALRKVAGDLSMVYLWGSRVPVQAFAGVFSSISNVCLIFLAVFFGRVGFLTALVILVAQFPMLAVGMFVRHNLTTIPGVFTNLFAVVSVCVVYINHSRVHKYQRRILTQAATDRLTGLPNRFACLELMDDLVKRQKKFVAVSIDLNNFRNINDTMGYEVGDKVLLEIAARWQSLSEAFKGADYVAHLGADKFFLILNGLAAQEEVESAISSYRKTLEEKITIDGCDYFVSACFGWAFFPADASDGGSAFSCADVAMHEIKRQKGKLGGVLKFTPDLLKTAKYMEMERKIRAALDNDLIFFQLQPQHDMNHKLRGFEALARMKDTDGSMIPPVEFIPVAEMAGLVDKIDARVFLKAAKFLGNISKTSGKSPVLSVNVSVRHLMKNNFIEELRSIIKESGLPANLVEIEITESIMIDSEEMALERIMEIKRMGMKVAIDDFGTGYSSLSYLNKFPADTLKIDKSFIDVMNESDSSKQYVSTIISIGHLLNLGVISEGVETTDQLETLQKIGCDYIQGYIWGKPLPPEEAAKLLLQNL